MIYLDHNATSPMLPEVATAMASWWGVPANPSSVHRAGQRAAMAVDRATVEVAELLGRPAEGIVFTSGATEANHMGIRGLPPGPAAIAPIEHPSAKAAAADRHCVRLRVSRDGVVDLDSCTEPVAVWVLMAANHETGVVQPVEDAANRAAATGAKLHIDATQAVGRVEVDLTRADTVVCSAHKLGGPPGIGALSLLHGGPFPPLLTGGSQQRGRRAGTVPTALVVGFGTACRLAREQRDERIARWTRLSEELRAGLVVLGGRIVGRPGLPNTTCVVFEDWVGETLVQALDLRGVCVSSGAACASGSVQPSPVLEAMGDEAPDGGVRFSLGPASTHAEIEAALSALREVLSARL